MIKKPPELDGDVKEQIEDIKTYLNMIYKQLILNTDNATEMLRTMAQAVSKNENGEISDLIGETISAKKLIVESDLDGSKTIIDGGAIKTGTVGTNSLKATQDGGVNWITFEDAVKFLVACRFMGGLLTFNNFIGVKSDKFGYVNSAGIDTNIYGNKKDVIEALQDLNNRVTNLGG